VERKDEVGRGEGGVLFSHLAQEESHHPAERRNQLGKLLSPAQGGEAFFWRQSTKGGRSVNLRKTGGGERSREVDIIISLRVVLGGGKGRGIADQSIGYGGGQQFIAVAAIRKRIGGNLFLERRGKEGKEGKRFIFPEEGTLTDIPCLDFGGKWEMAKRPGKRRERRKSFNSQKKRKKKGGCPSP